MPRVPLRYVPSTLSSEDKRAQSKYLKQSRKAYRTKKYITRKKVSSFKSKESPHIVRARKMYKVKVIKPSRELARATKCSLKALKRIASKGQGAYYSSGSRPNQTAHSWGYARLASAITGGKASAVDYHIIEKECKKSSKVVRLARKARKTYKNGLRRVRQVQI